MRVHVMHSCRERERAPEQEEIEAERMGLCSKTELPLNSIPAIHWLQDLGQASGPPIAQM